MTDADIQEGSYRTAAAVLGALAEAGMRAVFASPGSRSAPLAASAAGGLDLRMVLDERSAGFSALGMAAASGRMAGLICTSGTAGAHYLPAAAEANRARVPLAILTADRPPGFLERDAPQTIDQSHLFGSQVRAFLGLPVAHAARPEETARRVYAAARSGLPPNAGPVHINLPFAKPLEPPPGWTPAPRTAEAGESPAQPDPPSSRSVETLRRFAGEGRRGLVIVGPGRTSPTERSALAAWAAAAGWPLLADPLSGLRTGGYPGVVSTGEMLAADARLAAALRPQAVLRVGGTPTGRFLRQRLETWDCPQLLLDPDWRRTAPAPPPAVRDPLPGLLSAALAGAPDRAWAEAWREADEGAADRRREERRRHPDTEPAVAAAVLEGAETVWAAGSMPVRHLDLMMEIGPEVLGNRGACGIDGSLASAAGAALGKGGRVTALVGDLAFLHDLGSLPAAARMGAEVTAVVLDNGGGAIFGMLPIARSPQVDMERLFTFPHRLDLTQAAAGLGAPVRRTAPADLPEVLARAAEEGGTQVVVVETDPDRMRAAYRRLTGDGRK